MPKKEPFFFDPNKDSKVSGSLYIYITITLSAISGKLMVIYVCTEKDFNQESYKGVNLPSVLCHFSKRVRTVRSLEQSHIQNLPIKIRKKRDKSDFNEYSFF